ncbi:MAG: carbohydrate-binding domain-containing protein [Clostridiales bacterium]|nr:carbohydrate-binding domain-containing protein [Clostridiales bacterium]
MQTRSRKYISVLLTLLMMAGVIAAAPVVARAADHSVVIAGTDTVAQIQTNIQNKIDAAASGDTVTITGSKTGVAALLALTIPAGKKVIWKATYTGSNRTLITFYGKGTFEIAQGGTISTTGIGNMICNNDPNEKVTFVVSGGTLSVSGDGGTAICGDSGDVIVTGGTVEATGEYGYAIYSYTNITVSGGMVQATGADGRALDACEANVTISGGTVKATGDYGQAIKTTSGSVTVSGGTVQASDGDAIYSDSGDVTVSGGTVTTAGAGYEAIFTNGNVKISGGMVKATGAGGNAIYVGSGVAAYLAGTCTGGFFVNSGLIVEVDTLAVPAARDGASTGLTVKKGTGTAAWDCTGAKPVINFTIGTATKTMEWGDYYTAPPAKGIFGTNAKWYGAWWHYLLFFLGFGFIWMWF